VNDKTETAVWIGWLWVDEDGSLPYIRLVATETPSWLMEEHLASDGPSGT
jgi:hypothetical protein